jgi:hypothetical protein
MRAERIVALRTGSIASCVHTYLDELGYLARGESSEGRLDLGRSSADQRVLGGQGQIGTLGSCSIEGLAMNGHAPKVSSADVSLLATT